LALQVQTLHTDIVEFGGVASNCIGGLLWVMSDRPSAPAHGNLRAVQLLLGHTKIESTVRYLGIEVDDALAIAEQIDV
jgi:hypothetical protein